MLKKWTIREQKIRILVTITENPELGGSSNSNEGFDGSYSPKKQSVISAPHLINDHVNNNGKNEG